MEQDAVTITANGARIFGACAALLILLLVGAGLAPLAKADATYSCAGLPFSLTGFPGTDSCIAGVGECRVTGTITLVASARRQSESGLLRYYDNVRPLSYSFSDGIKTITQADYQPFFDFGTDSSVSINA